MSTDENIVQMYERGMSQRAIAALVGVSQRTICNALKKGGVNARKKGGSYGRPKKTKQDNNHRKNLWKIKFRMMGGREKPRPNRMRRGDTRNVSQFKEFVMSRARYDIDTGHFTEIATGKRLGSKNKRGYRMLGGRLEHRVVWLIVHGVWPEQEIDHVNGIKDDNRLHNLRLATRSENQRNVGKTKSNSSGFKGVYRDKSTGKWRAQMKIAGRNKWLGTYNNIEDASSAYRAAAKKYHGEFVRFE